MNPSASTNLPLQAAELDKRKAAAEADRMLGAIESLNQYDPETAPFRARACGTALIVRRLKNETPAGLIIPAGASMRTYEVLDAPEVIYTDFGDRPPSARAGDVVCIAGPAHWTCVRGLSVWSVQDTQILFVVESKAP